MSFLIAGGSSSPPPSQEKKCDILVVGDSFPFGSFVRSEKCFPALIHEALKKDVVNLAAPGTFPLYYNRMVKVGMRYDPELVVYCIYANDLIDSLFAKVDNDSLSADETFIADDKLFIDTLSFTHKAARMEKRILNCFKSWQVCKRLISYITFWQIGLLKDMRPVEFEGNISYCHPKFWHSALNLENESILQCFHNTLVNVEAAHRFTSEHGKQFLLVLIPCKEMVYGDLTKAFSSREIQQTYDLLEARLRKDDIAVLNLTDFFILKESENDRETLFLRTDVHFTKAGHKAAAEGITHFIQSHPFEEKPTTWTGNKSKTVKAL